MISARLPSVAVTFDRRANSGLNGKRYDLSFALALTSPPSLGSDRGQPLGMSSRTMNAQLQSPRGFSDRIRTTGSAIRSLPGSGEGNPTEGWGTARRQLARPRREPM